MVRKDARTAESTVPVATAARHHGRLPRLASQVANALRAMGHRKPPALILIADHPDDRELIRRLTEQCRRGAAG